MNILTNKNLINNVYSIKFMLEFTDEENALINKHGDPDVNYGGQIDYIQSSVDTVSVSVSNGVMSFGSSNDLSGVSTSDSVEITGTTINAGEYSIDAINVNDITFFEAINDFAFPETISFRGMASIMLPSNVRKLRAGNNMSETFDGSTDLLAKEKAEAYIEHMVTVLTVAIDSVRVINTFPGSETVTV